jgi:hypothetical protein
MKIQDYIKEHGLQKLVDEYKIEVKDYPDRVTLNYDQIESPRFDPICIEARGLILNKSDWSVMARSFDRFWNVGEDPNTKNFPLNNVNVRIEEKIDGCCDAETKLLTKNGEKTIKEICDKKLNVEVMGFDDRSKKKVWTKINNYSVKQNNNDWYEITTEDGNTIKLTGNHRIYLPKYNCYRKISEIKEGDMVLFL